MTVEFHNSCETFESFTGSALDCQAKIVEWVDNGLHPGDKIIILDDEDL